MVCGWGCGVGLDRMETRCEISDDESSHNQARVGTEMTAGGRGK